jgi:hypothetical protein
VEQRSRIEETLEHEAGRLVAHGDYLQHRIAAARNLNRYVTSEDLRAYVSDFIDTYCDGAQLVRVRDGDPPLWEIDLGPVVRVEFAEFLERERLQGRTRLATAASGRQPCVFENVLKRGRSDTESVSQYHPLIAFIRQRLDREERHRHPAVSAVMLTSSDTQGPGSGIYVFGVSRWIISGEQDSERLAFEVAEVGSGRSLDPDDAERLVTLSAMSGRPWPEAHGRLEGDAVGDAFDALMDRLEARYLEFSAQAGRENRDRVAFQLDQVARNEAREVQRLQGIVDRLRLAGKTRTIRANEGRIAKVRERAAERRARLASRQELRHEAALVCAGVILVE